MFIKVFVLLIILSFYFQVLILSFSVYVISFQLYVIWGCALCFHVKPRLKTEFGMHFVGSFLIVHLILYC